MFQTTNQLNWRCGVSSTRYPTKKQMWIEHHRTNQVATCKDYKQNEEIRATTKPVTLLFFATEGFVRGKNDWFHQTKMGIS